MAPFFYEDAKNYSEKGVGALVGGLTGARTAGRFANPSIAQMVWGRKNPLNRQFGKFSALLGLKSARRVIRFPPVSTFFFGGKVRSRFEAKGGLGGTLFGPMVDTKDSFDRIGAGASTKITIAKSPPSLRFSYLIPAIEANRKPRSKSFTFGKKEERQLEAIVPKPPSRSNAFFKKLQKDHRKGGRQRVVPRTPRTRASQRGNRAARKKVEDLELRPFYALRTWARKRSGQSQKIPVRNPFLPYSKEAKFVAVKIAEQIFRAKIKARLPKGK